MTETHEGTSFNENEVYFQSSQLVSLAKTTGLSFEVLVNKGITDLPRSIGEKEMGTTFSALSPTAKVKLFDAYFWASDIGNKEERLNHKPNLNRTINSLRATMLSSLDPQKWAYLADTYYQRKLLLTTKNPETIKKACELLGMDPIYMDSQSFHDKEKRTYEYATWKIGQIGEKAEPGQQEQKAPRKRFEQMRDSFMTLLNASTGINFKSTFDSDSSNDVAYGLGENYWKDIMKNLTEPEKVKLFDIRHLAKDLIAISGGKFKTKPNFTVSINSLEQALLQHFQPKQANFLEKTYQARISLLSTDDPEIARMRSDELNISYDLYLKDKPYQTVEGNIYGLTSQEVKNISNRKEQPHGKEYETDEKYRFNQAPPRQENERTHQQEDVLLTELIKNTPTLDPEVYKTYRGGSFEIGRTGIENFDRLFQVLLKKGDLTFDEKRHMFVFSDSSDRSVQQTMQKIIDTWGQGNPKSSEAMSREIATAAERVYLQHELRTKLPDDDPKFEDPEDAAKYFGLSTPGILKNPGVVLGLGLILTNNTRRLFITTEIVDGKEKVKSLIKSAYKKLALGVHPDQNKSDSANRKMRRLNEAYEILEDDNSFRKYSVL